MRRNAKQNNITKPTGRRAFWISPFAPLALRPSPLVLRPSTFVLRTSTCGDLRPSTFDLRPSPFDLRPVALAWSPNPSNPRPQDTDHLHPTPAQPAGGEGAHWRKRFACGRRAKNYEAHADDIGLGGRSVWWLGRCVVAATTQVQLLVRSVFGVLPRGRAARYADQSRGVVGGRRHTAAPHGDTRTRTRTPQCVLPCFPSVASRGKCRGALSV